MALLEVHALESGYGDVQILWGVDLSLSEGKVTSIVGTNGAGKTTLLRTVMGALKPWKGSIKFQGKDVSNQPPYQRADLGLVLVPEGRQLFPRMSVVENLEMGATNKRARGHIEQNKEQVFDLFPRLAERRTQKAGTLSGGEQQMLAVARGLMAEPIALMFDELSLGLAPVLVISMFETINKLRLQGLTMLLVEQNVHLALSISDYAYVLSEGRISLEGTASDLSENPLVQKAYLGI